MKNVSLVLSVLVFVSACTPKPVQDDPVCIDGFVYKKAHGTIWTHGKNIYIPFFRDDGTATKCPAEEEAAE